MTALLLGITPRGFADWKMKPYERKGNQVFYYWPNVLEERDRRYFGVDDDDLPVDGRLELDQERARHSKEQADKLAIENAHLRGEIAYLDHVGEIWGRLLGAFRAKLLAMASKLAPRVNPGAPTLARELIEREVYDALTELAEFDLGDMPQKREKRK